MGPLSILHGIVRSYTFKFPLCKLICSIHTYNKINLAPIVQMVDIVIHRINLCVLDSAIGFPNTYPLDSDLSRCIVLSIF